MARKATIFKAAVNVANVDQHYYADHELTVARHPSETDERMMIRLLAFALNASDRLEFGKGLSTDDEPALWQSSLSGEIECWIELGLPEENRLRKACGRAQWVILYTYGGRAVPLWWEKQQSKLSRFDNLTIIDLAAESTAALAALAERAMTLQITIQDGDIGVAGSAQHVQLTPTTLM